MQAAAGRARLIWGISEGEFLFTALLIGAALAIYIANVITIFPKVAQVEAFSLASHGKVYWAELWATEGVREPAVTAPVSGDQRGKYLHSLDGDVADGSIDFAFTGTMPTLDGHTLTMRPALSRAEGTLSVIWVCGRAAAPAGFAIRGEDATDLPGNELMASCRERRR